MRIYGTEKHINFWAESEKVPLGKTTGENQAVIYKRLTHMADSFFFFARPGVGKSVMLKLFYYFLWLSRRPLIIFDPTGMDHRLSYKPNKYAINLPPNTSAGGIAEHPIDPEKKVAYLNVAEYHFDWERRYLPNINSLERSELLSLGFSDGAQDEMRKILKTYGPFEDYEELIDFINKFPVNPGDAKRNQTRHKKGLFITKHHTFYKEGAYLNQQSKSNMLRILFKLSEEKLISLHGKEDFDFMSWIKAGNSIVFSFNRDYDVTRSVVSLVAKKILKWKTQSSRGEQLWLIFEEMDKVFPQYPREREREIVEYLSELILQLRKLSLGIAGSCASMIQTNKNIIENAHNIIFGQIKGRNLNEIRNFYNPATADKVKNLYWNRHANFGKGEREFLYIDEMGNQFKINPFESPCEIHREIKQR